MTGRYAVEIALTWAGVGLYLAATVALVFSVVFEKPGARRWGLAFAALGLLPHGAAIAIRWVAVGHGPYMLRYEVLSSNAWVAVAVLFLVLARRPGWSALAVVVMPLAILSVAIGLFSNPESRDLPPTLRSIWLVFHITFAKVSAAAFLVSLGSSVLLLLKERRSPWSWLERVPATPALDALTIRAAGFGMIFWTVTIAAGAIWGNQSWGRYWGWDPIETWALVSWMTYGTFLHLRFFFKLRPRPTAWLSIASFVVFVLALLVLPFFITSLHSSYFS
ncbi:MAG TPA: cytochrome c biogenesis protein CcsA [Anaeromyxobacteraceae bacterium]|nr:cytochrome c biogenesis protein CcsA [Anaeromyxobacteraceae bacterium]